MRIFSRILSYLFIIIPLYHAHAEERPVFGPARFDVIERYGKENRYIEKFKADEEAYLIKLQNGEKASERPDFMGLSVNGETLLREGIYDYRFMACFVTLRRDNTIELMIKDAKPPGFKRPLPTPKFAVITAMRPPVRPVNGVFGINSWDELEELTGMIGRIKDPAAQSHAVKARDLRNSKDMRAGAMRMLGQMKDQGARDFIIMAYGDIMERPEVRGEAAVALGIFGDKKDVPLLISGLVDPEEETRTGAARALALFDEKDTRGPFIRLLTSLDYIRDIALMKAVVGAGWKPVGALVELAGYYDQKVSNAALELLGELDDPRAADAVIGIFNDPGVKDIKVVIAVLGRVKDGRAAESLLRMAEDPARREGNEIELAEALANKGDQKAAEAIKDMAMKSQSPYVRARLIEAYRKLTGMDLTKNDLSPN